MNLNNFSKKLQTSIDTNSIININNFNCNCLMCKSKLNCSIYFEFDRHNQELTYFIYCISCYKQNFEFIPIYQEHLNNQSFSQIFSNLKKIIIIS